MKIIIEIDNKNEEPVDNIFAVGAKDLAEHFLPKIHIKPDKVTISNITDENLKTS